MIQVFSRMVLILNLVLLAACGGNGSNTNTPPVIVVIPEQPELDFTAVQAEIDRHSVTDMAILIGDSDGILFRYEKGDFQSSDIVNIASATKLITGLGVWTLIEDETLSETDSPKDYINFWTSDPMDSRSGVTVSQLMSFTSGFNNPPTGRGCQGSENYVLEDCVRETYTDGIDTRPGEAFSYGPEHMQIAALMARSVTGIDLKEIIRRNVLDPVGVSQDMAFAEELGDNPRYSGGMNASADDYALVLTELLSGDLISNIDGFLTDRTINSRINFTLPAIENTQLDWHYGFGFWKECDFNPYQQSCSVERIISSPGAFGFLPWVDFENGYWAILAMQEPLGLGRSPSTDSVELEQVLQPMILTAFNP